MSKLNHTLKKFLSFFPQVDLPITLGIDTHHIFSEKNKPLSESVIKEVLLPLFPEHTDIDEYVPCFSIPPTDQYYAVVYWRAGLLQYEYYLLTFDREGNLITNRSIAGQKSNNQDILNRVATLEKDRTILIVQGTEQPSQQYDAGSSQKFHFEIQPDGSVIDSLHDD